MENKSCKVEFIFTFRNKKEYSFLQVDMLPEIYKHNFRTIKECLKTFTVNNKTNLNENR